MKKRRNIFLVLAVLWMCLIFSFSARPAELSSNDSYEVGILVGKIFVPGFEELDLEEQTEFAKKIDHPVRKCAHFTEYMILGIFFASAFIGNIKKKQTEIMASFLLGASYAASDELHQLFVPGRSGQISDVMLDSAGVLTGVLLVFLLARLFLKKKRG